MSKAVDRHFFLQVDKPQAEQYPLVEGLTCINVKIPDSPEYVYLLQGFVAFLTNYWTFTGSDELRRAVAQLWLIAYTATDWENCMDCSGVQDCIETDSGVQGAINNLYNSQSTNHAMPASVADTNLISGNPTCDLDILWGALWEEGLIGAMNASNQDALQKGEQAGNVLERLSLLISAVPVFETLPVDELIVYVQTIWTNDIAEAYLAADDQEYRDAITWDLFCFARNHGCVLSIRDVYNYFVRRITANPEDTLADLINFIVGGTWEGTEIDDIFYALQAACMFYGNKFFNAVGLYPFQSYLANGAQHPSNYWAGLGLECPGCYFWNFLPDQADWDIVDAVWTLDTGYSQVTTDVTKLVIQYDFATPTDLQSITLHSAHADMFIDVTTDTGDIVLNDLRLFNADDTWTYLCSITDANWLRVAFRRSLPDGAGMILKDVSVEYAGDIPTGGNDCTE